MSESEHNLKHNKKSAIAVELGIVSFMLILATTWFSLLFPRVRALYYEYCIIGVISIIVFGLSIFVLYRLEAQMKPSIWRLAEKITILSGFIFTTVAWFFSGFRGTLQKVLHPWAWALSILGIILTIAGLISRTEGKRT